MQMPQVAPGYTPPMGQAAMAKARLMGYTPPSAGGGKSEDKDAIKERRKREKANRKKNRKKK